MQTHMFPLEKNNLFSKHMHSDSREMNKAAVSHHGASQMINSDMVGSKSEKTGTAKVWAVLLSPNFQVCRKQNSKITTEEKTEHDGAAAGLDGTTLLCVCEEEII